MLVQVKDSRKEIQIQTINDIEELNCKTAYVHFGLFEEEKNTKIKRDSLKWKMNTHEKSIIIHWSYGETLCISTKTSIYEEEKNVPKLFCSYSYVETTFE